MDWARHSTRHALSKVTHVLSKLNIGKQQVDLGVFQRDYEDE